MTELVITQQELAKAIGKNKKTVERYLNDENSLKTLEKNTSLVMKIISFVQEKACFKTYHHIENRIFLKFFREYVKFLNQKQKIKISQQQLAEIVGVKQKTISVYLNPKSDVKLNAETQYKILNFLIIQNIEGIYNLSFGQKFDVDKCLKSRVFDYLGYFILSTQEWNVSYLFLLLQNRKVYSKIDEKMRFYILHYPPVLHALMERQFEACFRFAEVLSNSTNLREKSEKFFFQQEKFGIYKIYQHLDSEIYVKILEKILDEVIMAFQKKVIQQEILIAKNPASDYDIILKMQLEAVVNYKLLGTKKEQTEFIHQLKFVFAELTESDKKRLFGDLQTVFGNIIPDEKISQKKLSSTEDVVKALCSFPIALQDILLEYSSVFFNFDDYFYFRIHKFTNHILYPFMKKILKQDLPSSIIPEIESKAFGRLFDKLTVNFEEYGRAYGLGEAFESVYKNFQKFQLQESLEIYIKLYSLSYETIPDLLEQEFVYSEKNKQQFLEKISNMKQENLEDLLKIISYKLKFYPEDWYLWGVIQLGMRVDCEKIYAEIFKSFDSAEEMIELTEDE